MEDLSLDEPLLTPPARDKGAKIAP